MERPDAPLFPLDNLDPNQKGFEWIAAVGRGIDYKYQNNRFYLSPADTTRLQMVRNYSNGNQGADKYIDMWVHKGDEKTHPNSGGSQNHGTVNKRGKRKGYANLSWEIVSIAQTLKRIVSSLVGTETQFCDVESLTKDAKNKKLLTKYKTFIRAKITPLLKELNVPVKEDYFVPKDKVSLEMYEMVGGFNLNFEINAKKIIEHGLHISKYHNKIEKLIKDDAYNFNFIVTKIYCDPVTGAAKVKYIDPARFIAPWMDESQGDNAPFAGAYVSYSIPELRDLLSKYHDEDTVEQMCLEAASSAFQAVKVGGGQLRGDWQWYQQRDTFTQRLRYDEFFVDVLEFEYISKDQKFYKKRRSKNNPAYADFNEASYGYKSESGNKETVVIEGHVIYEGWYIPCLDKAVGGLQNNMIRINKKTPCLSYSMVKISGKAIGESLIPILDMLMIAHVKLQAAVLAAKPKGISVEIASLNGLNIGGELFKPQDLISIYSQTGVLMYKATLQQGKVIASGVPITELEGGVGRQLSEWAQLWAMYVEKAFQISGITPIMGASPDVSGEKLVGVANAERQATINNLATMQDALEEMHQYVCAKILAKTLVVAAADEAVKEYYANLIGQNQVDELLLVQGVSLDELGITVTKKLSTMQTQGVMEALLKAQTGGRDGVSLIDPSDDMFVRSMIERGRYEEAMRYLQYIVNEKKKQYQEESAAASAQQAQQLQQLEVTKMQTEVEKEKQKAMIEIEKEKAMSVIRVAEEKAKIDAEMKADAYLIQVEGMVQVATGKDVGSKIPVDSQLSNQIQVA